MKRTAAATLAAGAMLTAGKAAAQKTNQTEPSQQPRVVQTLDSLKKFSDKALEAQKHMIGTPAQLKQGAER